MPKRDETAGQLPSMPVAERATLKERAFPVEHIPEKDARRKLTPHQANRLLDSWYNKFGKVVFLVLDYGKKQFRNSDWEKITFEQTLAAPYRSCLVYALVRGGNIAVRLGPLSDGLRAIDIDIKDRVEEFARINPALQNTVIVHGRKGAQFFFRNDGKFLHKNKAVDKLKTLAGEDYGELRHGENGGAYSMIYGQHPDDANVTFRLEGDSVASLQFYQHHWPSDVILPWLEQEPFKANQKGGREGVAGAAAVLDAQLERRIKAYLEQCPPSIAGEHGDDRLFAAACKILGGFALDVEQTAEMLAAYFNPRCEPPWPYQRLLYKARQAAEANLQKPRGYLLDEAEASQNSKEACGGEGEENEENDGSCPYPAVDWATLDPGCYRLRRSPYEGRGVY